jgi:hypothetical protein
MAVIIDMRVEMSTCERVWFVFVLPAEQNVHIPQVMAVRRTTMHVSLVATSSSRRLPPFQRVQGRRRELLFYSYWHGTASAVVKFTLDE